MFRDERGSFSKEKLLNKGKGSNERHGNHHKRIFSRQTMELFFSRRMHWMNGGGGVGYCTGEAVSRRETKKTDHQST